MGKLVGRELSVVFSQPGPRFQTYRKLLKAWLNPEASKRHHYIQLEEVRNFIKDLARGGVSKSQSATMTPISRRSVLDVTDLNQIIDARPMLLGIPDGLHYDWRTAISTNLNIRNIPSWQMNFVPSRMRPLNPANGW
jgi:cytochrome P450